MRVLKLDSMMKCMAETQKLEPDDKLSGLIRESCDDELSLDEMDMIAAAGTPDINRFKNFMKSKRDSE